VWTRVQRLLPALWLALATCGEDLPIDRHVEDLVTIAHGIYGQVTTVDDVGEPMPAYLPGFAIGVFAVPAGSVLGNPVATATSGARGFYEIELPAGDQVLCTAFERCVLVTLVAGELSRIDYEFSLGPGWSRGSPWPAP